MIKKKEYFKNEYKKYDNEINKEYKVLIDEYNKLNTKNFVESDKIKPKIVKYIDDDIYIYNDFNTTYYRNNIG